MELRRRPSSNRTPGWLSHCSSCRGCNGVRMRRSTLSWAFSHHTGSTGLVELVGMGVAAIQHFAHELPLMTGQHQGHGLEQQALRSGRTRQLRGDLVGIVQRDGVERYVLMLAQPGHDLGAKQLLAAPVMVNQVGALADRVAFVDGDAQAELFENVGTLGPRIQIVHQFDGALQQAGIVGVQPDYTGIDQRHLIIGQAARQQFRTQRGVEHALRAFTVANANRIAQQAARRDALEQRQWRLMEKGIGIDQQGHFGLAQHFAQRHVLDAEMIAVRLHPGFAGGRIEIAYPHWQVAIGRRVIGEYLDVEAVTGGFPQARQGAADAEDRFAMVGVGTEHQVGQLRA